MEKQSALRIGLVGCGGHGRNLAQAIARSKSLRLVACADPDETAASRAAALATEVSTHTSVEALLADREVDAIIVATPHHLLAPVALAALRAGKHVMAEKPIALNEREAAEIEQVATQAGVCFMAGYSFRFLMARYVRELVDAGVAGEIRSVSGAIGYGPMNNGWNAYPETGGGPLLFLGSHLVDLVLWFLPDEAQEVFAHLTYRADTGADDTSAFQIRFANGAVAQCLVTQAASDLFYELTLHGSAGTISLRGRSFLHFEISVISTEVAAYREPTVIRPLIWGDHISAMLVPELEEFAQSIREQRAPTISAADGRRVLRILDAVIKSGQSHQPVILNN
ncbi:MAG: Gfo/Idh/MocA family oxidoreductase [Chloroflexota bacterium]